jgi:hypothetical protein
MHITQVAAAFAPSGISGVSLGPTMQPGRGDFAQVMKAARGSQPGLSENSTSLRVDDPLRAQKADRPQLSEKVGAAVQSVAEAQARLDAVLRSAQSGRGLSPAALLGLQADVYRSSQLLELAGKVVERGSAGVRQVLTTQL